GSAKKAWWLCTQFGHEWQGTVNSRKPPAVNKGAQQV
ncbi:zinc-ribbon domain-containing protein, partial [Rhodococcus baikonurensis]